MNKIIRKFLVLFGILCLLYFIAITIFIGYINVFNLIWIIIAVFCLIIYKKNEKILKLLAKTPKIIKVLFLAAAAAFILSFIIIEGQIINNSGSKNTENACYAILLGAGLNGSQPSLTLLHRINTAVEYLNRNKNIKVVASGGKGARELFTEAEVMSKLLQNNGVEIDRIIIEDRSANTKENLAYSKSLIDIDKKIIIISSGYHLFRAKGIAKKTGYKDIGGMAGKTPLLLLPNYYIREYFAVLKELMTGNL